MAKSPENVRNLLMQVWKPARAQAEKDQAKLAQMMKEDGINGEFQAWDWRYYSEKRRKIEFDLDESELKPYLQLDRMIEASFSCANRLFGLEFRQILNDLFGNCARWHNGR